MKRPQRERLYPRSFDGVMVTKAIRQRWLRGTLVATMRADAERKSEELLNLAGLSASR